MITARILCLLFVISSTFNIYAFNAQRFETETCQQLIFDRGNGYYSVNEPLIFQAEGEDTVVLQRVRGSERNYYQVYDSFGTYRLWANLKKVQDFVVYQADLWVLSEGSLYQFDDTGKLLNTFRYRHSERHQKPMGLDLKNGELLIAHGKMGLVKFNLKKQEFSFFHDVNTWQTDGRRSKAVAVTWSGDKIYVALTSVSQGSFNGIVILDTNTMETINTPRYRNGREGVIDPQAKIYVKKDGIYLNNGGWIHRHTFKDLESRRNAKPYWMSIPYRFGELNRFLRIRGDFLFQNNEITGCALNERTPVFARRVL